jgi:hypothetical protein
MRSPLEDRMSGGEVRRVVTTRGQANEHDWGQGKRIDDAGANLDGTLR